MQQIRGYRSSRRTLEQLARSYVLYESGGRRGDWDHFRIRNLALRCTQRQKDGAGDPLALVLRTIPDFKSWPATEKAGVNAIVRAKHNPEEWRYLRLMQRHSRLRAAMLRLGSTGP